MEWLTTELKLLSQVYGTAPLPDIQREHFPHRTEYALQRKASHIGLSSKQVHKRKVSSEELIEMIELGYHPERIAEETGLTRKGVYSAVRDRKDIPKEYYQKLKVKPLNPVQRKLMRHLPFKLYELQKKVDIPSSTVKYNVKQLVQNRRIIRQSDGWYVKY